MIIFQALSFHRMADDVDGWMDEVEGHLSSEDHGKDIVTVNNLLKRHQVRDRRCLLYVKAPTGMQQ